MLSPCHGRGAGRTSWRGAGWAGLPSPCSARTASPNSRLSRTPAGRDGKVERPRLAAHRSRPKRPTARRRRSVGPPVPARGASDTKADRRGAARLCGLASLFRLARRARPGTLRVPQAGLGEVNDPTARRPQVAAYNGLQPRRGLRMRSLRQAGFSADSIILCQADHIPRAGGRAARRVSPPPFAPDIRVGATASGARGVDGLRSSGVQHAVFRWRSSEGAEGTSICSGSARCG